MNDVLEIIAELATVPGKWKTLGPAVAILAGVMALVALTKIPAVENLLKIRKWLRPTVGAALGLVAGIASALAQHLPWIGVIGAGITGMISGLAATGLDQLFKGWSPAAKEQALATAASAEIVARSDVHVTTAVRASPAAKDLAEAVAVTDPRERRRELASWAMKHLPATAVQEGPGSPAPPTPSPPPEDEDDEDDEDKGKGKGKGK